MQEAPTQQPAAEASLTLTVDARTIAKALNVSVEFLQKDRRTKRLIPFIRVGRRILYNPQNVMRKLAELEEGGVAPRGRRRSAA